jgi:hypothetical protein
MTDLVDATQLAAYIKEDTATWNAARAQLCLDGAMGAVVEYCGWHIAPSLTADIVVDGSGTRLQPLPTMNLTALNTVVEDGSTLDVDQIDWSSNGLLEKRGCDGRYGAALRWTARRRGVAVNVTHGFTNTPSWVVTLVCAVAARGFLTAPGVAQEAAGGESVTYATPGALPPGSVVLSAVDKKMLDRIRVPLAA